MLNLAPESLARGVTAVSAGNHAIATAWAARELGTHAKLVMFASANPARVAKVRRYGGEVVIVPDVAQAFETAKRIEAEEGRTFVHPYEGPRTARGTATLGLEWLEQVPDLDAMIVPIGGGGLIAGIACAVKQLRPDCLVLGVEPTGADSMWRSFAAGSPQAIDQRRHHRRQPGRTLRAALQLRPVPPLRRRDRADRGRGHGRGDAPGLRRAQAGAGARGCRRDGSPARPPARAPGAAGASACWCAARTSTSRVSRA